MKKVSLTKMIMLGLIFGMTAGVVINNMAAAEIAKSYAADISVLTAIFLRMVEMIITPLVISTLAVGVAKMGDAKALGHIFSKTSLLFICASLVPIALGLVIANIFQPGADINFVPHDVRAVAAVKSEPSTPKVFILHTVSTSIVDVMAYDEILQIVVFSIFLGCSLAAIGEEVDPIVEVLDSLVRVMLKLTGCVMLFVSLTVFATISGLIAERGLGVMVSARIFMGEFYLTLGVLWVTLIGPSTIVVGPCITQLTKSILEPALLVFTASSSEAAFPGTLDKLEKFGVSLKVVSFVLPIGYSFNLVGSMVYCSFAIIFIAQACDIELSMGEQITMLLTLMPTPKGVADVPRAPIMVITATPDQFNAPEAGLVLLMGVDPFLDMGCSAISVVSNAMGIAVVGRRRGEHYDQGCRGTAPVRTPKQERSVIGTEVALFRQQKND